MKTFNFSQSVSSRNKSLLRHVLPLLLLILSVNGLMAQQVIGSFPTMDGGFEGQAASGTALVGTSIGTGVQRTDWTCGTASYGTVQSATPRTGSKYINFNLTAATKRIQSPTAGNGAIVGASTYIVQYYYRTSGATAPGGTIQTVGASSDGTNPTSSISYTNIGAIGTTTSASNILTSVTFHAPIVAGASITGTGIPASTTITSFTSNTITISNYATANGSNIALTIPLAATNNTWTKLVAKVTAANSTPSPKYGYFAAFRTSAAMAAAVDMDDFVAYAGTTVDETAPDPITLPNQAAAAATQQTISWTAPVAGVDGGGYMVVRGLADPTTTPNANGIYKIGNTVAAGEQVVYLGTSTSFVDLGLTPSTTYYYRI
ncbi:MAG: hypothetical protein ACOYMD_16235 [Paludibacter sp.]